MANAIQTNLGRDLEVTVWDQEVFAPSHSALESLCLAMERFDAAAFVLSPDDVSVIRDKKEAVARDNVVFELGLFIGRLGRKHVFMIIPEGESGLHLPTDLLGIVAVYYDPRRSDGNLIAATRSGCEAILRVMHSLPSDRLIRSWSGEWNGKGRSDRTQTTYDISATLHQLGNRIVGTLTVFWPEKLTYEIVGLVRDAEHMTYYAKNTTSDMIHNYLVGVNQFDRGGQYIRGKYVARSRLSDALVTGKIDLNLLGSDLSAPGFVKERNMKH